MAQAVNAHVRKVMLPTDLLDGAPQAVLGDVQYRPSGLPIPLDGRCQLRDHHRHIAGGGGVFVLCLPLIFVVLIEHYGALYTDEIRVFRNVLPAQALDLGDPQGGEPQQCGDSVSCVLHTRHKHPDLVWREKWLLLGHRSRQGDLRELVASSMPHHASNEGEGRSERFRSAQRCLRVNDALPLAVIDLIQPTGHGGLEAVFLDGAVSPDGQGRKGIAALFDVGVDGLR